MENEYITVSDAAKLTGLTDRSIRRLASGASGQTSGASGLPIVKQDTQKKPYKLLILRDFIISHYSIDSTANEQQPDAPDVKTIQSPDAPDTKGQNISQSPDAPDVVRVELERIISAKDETISILKTEINQLHKTLERKDVLLQNAINALQTLELGQKADNATPQESDALRPNLPANTQDKIGRWFLVAVVIAVVITLFWVASM